jgi:hypothetical protein
MRLIAVTVLAVLLAGCGGPSKEDVSGTWETTLNYTTCVERGVNSRGCGPKLSSPFTTEVTLVQTGSAVSGTIIHSPVVLEGTVIGQTLELDGFGTGITGANTTQSWRLKASDNRMTGNLAESSNGPDIGGGTWTSSSTADVQMVRRR